MDKSKTICSPRFRLDPNEEQKRLIDITLDATRYVYNYFLTVGKLQYAATGIFPTRYEMQSLLPALKSEEPWLKEADSVALQIAVQHLSWTFNNFMERKFNGLPVRLHFKSRFEFSQSYRRTAGRGKKDPSVSRHVRIAGNTVKISKVGFVKFRQTQPVEGRIVSATVTREGTDEYAEYYISFYYEPDSPRLPVPETGKAVGIDLGLRTYATLSSGEKIDFCFTAHQDRLDELYDTLRRKEPGSKNWEKTYNQIRRLSQKIRRSRTDAFHKLAAELVRRYNIICMETLNTYAMMRKVPRMRYSVQRASWGEFRRILERKCEDNGKQLVQIGRFYPSSQMCSICGRRWPGARRLDVREWTCPVCDANHDRDINAARNILREGLRILSQSDSDAA